MDGVTQGETCLRFGAALGLGVLLGLERERKNRPVGFRTMILINLGSAGLMLAGQEAIRLGGRVRCRARISRSCCKG